MRYLSTEPMKLPKPMTVGEPPVDASVAGIGRFLLETYQQLPALQTTTGHLPAICLDASGLRSRGKALDILEGSPDDGYYLIDEAEWKLIRMLAEFEAPRLWLKHTDNVPAILDALDACPSKKPVKEPTIGEEKAGA